MFLTEQEILDTPRALERTCRYFDERLEEHKNFFARNAQKKFAFFWLWLQLYACQKRGGHFRCAARYKRGSCTGRRLSGIAQKLE